MKTLPLLSVGLMLATASHQSAVKFTSGGAVFYLKPATGLVEKETVGEKRTHIKVQDDNLVTLHSPEKGFTAVGKELEFTWAELNPKTNELRDGRLEGSARILFDGAESVKSLADAALLAGKPAPPTPAETSTLQLDSDVLLYKGDVKRGTITMPKAWTLHNVTQGIQIKKEKGTDVRVQFDQTLDADGTSGTVTVVPDKKGNLNQIETGTLQGPVHFKIVRHERPIGASVVTTTSYDGVADHVEIDLRTVPGTVVTHGHVTVNVKSPEMEAQFKDDSFILSVDEQLQPIKVTFEGTPGKTKVKSKDGQH